MAVYYVIVLYLSMEPFGSGICKKKTVTWWAAVKILFCGSEIFKGLVPMSGLFWLPCISSLIELLQSFITSNYLTWPE